jgi:hypothetical protein
MIGKFRQQIMLSMQTDFLDKRYQKNTTAKPLNT